MSIYNNFHREKYPFFSVIKKEPYPEQRNIKLFWDQATGLGRDVI